MCFLLWRRRTGGTLRDARCGRNVVISAWSVRSPHRPRWMPGNGGLALHTILLDPADKQRMYVAISAGGVYRTDDGGSTWAAQNRGIRAMFMPGKYPEFGQCVHKIAMHPAPP